MRQSLQREAADMKHASRQIGRFGLVTVLLLAVSLSASGVDLCSFRSPLTDLTFFFMTFNYSYMDLPDTPHIDVSSGRFSASFSRTHDESDFALSTAATAEVSFDHLKLERVLGDAYMSSRFYVADADPLYMFAEVRADYANASVQSGLELRFGTGLGRLTDVSPLARAIRIESTLLDAFVLPGPLSDTSLQTMGQLIGREEEFSGIGALVSAIESIIESDSGVALDTRALLSIAEQIRSEVVSQQCGWTAQVGLGYELLRRFGGTRKLLLSLSTDLARPMGLTSQVKVHADISYPLFIDTMAYALSTSAQYSRRLSEATRLVAKYALQRVRQITKDTVSGENVEVQLLFDLGRVDLTLSGTLSRGTGSAGWTELFSVAARVDLL